MTDTIYGQISSQDNARALINMAQRTPSELELFQKNNDKLSRQIKVMIPCQVVSFDSEKQTITAQPLIREKVINRANGQEQWITLPQLLDVPVCFLQAGNFVLTMPIQPGDEVVVVFSDSCIDGWHQSGGIQNWMDRRRHDLSDGIAIIGLNSLPNTIADFNENGTELRQKAGTGKVAIEGKSILFVGVPVPYDEVRLESETSSIVMGKTIKIVIIEGVPTPVLMDTIALNAERIMINGVDL